MFAWSTPPLAIIARLEQCFGPCRLDNITGDRIALKVVDLDELYASQLTSTLSNCTGSHQ